MFQMRTTHVICISIFFLHQSNEVLEKLKEEAEERRRQEGI